MNPRYVIAWVPLEEVKATCAKAGMKDGDGTSYWDWVEPCACEHSSETGSFKSAVEAARQVLPKDTCGQVRIERLCLEQDRDDLGNFFNTHSWETDAVWHLTSADDELSEDKPDVA